MAALLLLFTHREGCAEENMIGFCFVFDSGTQSMAVGVTRYVLLLFLTARFLLPSSLPSCLYVCVMLSITTGRWARQTRKMYIYR